MAEANAMPDRPKVCAVISDGPVDCARKAILQAGSEGARLVELRMDHISRKPQDAAELVGFCHENGISCIVTYRDKAEGGLFEGSGSEKAELFRAAIEAGADYVDAEIRHEEAISAVLALARKKGCKLIASWHDFSGAQPPMETMIPVLHRQGMFADIGKIAFYLDSRTAVDWLLSQAKSYGLPLIVSPMGEGATLELRAYCVRQGSPFAYGYVGRPAAPGMPSFSELKRELDPH